MPEIKKKILVSTGNFYDANFGEYKILDENGQITKTLKTGMWIEERKKFSQFFGKKMKIMGFDEEKEILFVRSLGMNFAEFYERWLPKNSFHRGREEVDCFLNLERTDAPFLVQIGENIGEKVGRAARFLNGLCPSEIFSRLKWSR